MEEAFLSMGIDIGTTTTQIIFSRFWVRNNGSVFSAPEYKIVKKEILYKSAIYRTPLVNNDFLKEQELLSIVFSEYEKAGIKKEEIKTGAVIITGEAARKENAQIVLDTLSTFAGEFVVSTAGPDLESELSGKGSGACEWSRINRASIANVDIGGGTTNISIYKKGENVGNTCLDIGGHLIQGSLKKIDHISRAAQNSIDHLDLKIEEKSSVKVKELIKLTDYWSDLILKLIFEPSKIGKEIELYRTKGSSMLEYTEKVDAIMFSGGVSDCIIERDAVFLYDDIGDFLGRSLFFKLKKYKEKWIECLEPIRATVIGAGMYTTKISGSTIFCNVDQLPIKNIPVFCLDLEEINQLFKEASTAIERKLQNFIEQRDISCFAISLELEQMPSFQIIEELAVGLHRLFTSIKYQETIIVIVNVDCAKALGQMIDYIFGYKRKILCIDQIKVKQGYSIDIGKSILNSSVIPVIIKTLEFETDS